jgi:AraC-like DNA-binding protein
MAGLSFEEKQLVLADLVRQLASQKIVQTNDVTAQILAHLDDINNVTDMAGVTGLSPRQLQRILQQATGFQPHDLIKILRLQRAMKQGYPMLYTDQSHFIRSFRAITGYTPVQYFDKFNV